MKKNVASQSVGAQMITAADGTDFTGTVTVVITIDNGTQSASGGTAPAHEGNGYHSYTPTQAETNGDHIAFTFTGSGAITTSVQVYTTFPQTGDSFARLAAPSGASVSADIAAIKAETALIVADTNELQTDDVPGLIATAQTDLDTLTGTDGVILATSQPNYAPNTTTPPTAAAVADAVLDEALSAHIVAGSLGKAVADLESDATAILADTNELQTDDVPGLIATAQTDLDTITGTDGVTLATAQGLYAPAKATDIVSAGAITTSSGAVSNVTLVATTTTNTDMLTAAAVNAEVVDALNVDTYAESAGVPAATATLVAKIGWLATLARNKITQTATTQTLRDDADGADIAASTVSDDGTTATRGEFV